MSDYLSEQQKKVLELDTRRKIYGFVVRSPGSHFREVERGSKLSVGSSKYHLTYLVKKGLLSEEKSGKTVRYFPASFTVSNKTLMSFLRQKSIRDILLFILLHDTCTHEDIVQSVTLSASTVSWHLKKLNAEEIISLKREGRKTFCRLKIDKDELITLLISYQESFFDTVVDRIVEMFDR